MRYYIADCHFFHGVLNTKMDKRGFDSSDSMNEYMIQKCNAKVKSTDEVVIIGIHNLLRILIFPVSGLARLIIYN